MSEQLSSAPNDNDLIAPTSDSWPEGRPALVPGINPDGSSNGRVNVMRVKSIEGGIVTVIGADPDGKEFETRGDARALSEKVQSYYADKLALSRPSLTQEQLQRGDPNAEQYDIPTKIDAIKETYLEGGDSTELMMRDSQRAYRERLTNIAEEFNERAATLIARYKQSDEHFNNHQVLIKQGLDAVAGRLAASAPVSPNSIGEIIDDLQSVDRSLSQQAEATDEKRRVSSGVHNQVDETKVQVQSSVVENDAFINHLTEDSIESDEDGEKERRESGYAAQETLNSALSLEKSINELDAKLPEISGRVQEAQRSLRIARGRLQELQESLRRTGQLDYDAFNHARVIVNQVLEDQPLIKKVVDALPSISVK